MKRFAAVWMGVLLCGYLAAQESFIKQSLVVNIEVPVRVFSGDRFVEDLTIDDFEILEDGKRQNLEAVYLIKRRSIERSEENHRFLPDTERFFFFFFEVAEYLPKLGEAMAYFVENILMPDDNLIVVTPLKTYRLKGRALKFKTREQIQSEISGKIRADAWKGNAEYRDLIQELTLTSKALAAALAGTNDESGLEQSVTQLGDARSNPFATETGLTERLAYYLDLIYRLENLRRADQHKLLDFADYLKEKIGRKYVFVFYQQEFIPKIDSRLLEKYLYDYQDDQNLIMKLNELEGLSVRRTSFDVDLIKRSYADAATSIHFLFVKHPPREILQGIRHEERSEDIFSAFFEMARATGGVTIASSNPAASFRQAVASAEQYYLLYYSPKTELGDGAFRTIDVKIKRPNLRVHHRAGYFAR